MMPAGGYQRPTSPAPVSGPGAMSQRTDGGPGSSQTARYVAGMPYGEGADFMDIQSMAPMAAAPNIPSASSMGSAPSQLESMEPASIIPLNAPSMRPSEPITTGVDVGPGAGPEALPPRMQNQKVHDLASSLQPLLEYDTTGDIALLYRLAVSRGW